MDFTKVMREKSKVEEWLIKKIDAININEEEVCDLHVDEFTSLDNLSKSEVIQTSIDLFELFLQFFKSSNKHHGLMLYLSVELVEKSAEIVGAPSNFEHLCDEFEEDSVPEIILYKPKPLVYPVNSELYSKPLIFPEFSKLSEDVLYLYKENRTYDMLESEDDFFREFIVVYTPPLF